jgi:hypothetical protein
MGAGLLGFVRRPEALAAAPVDVRVGIVAIRISPKNLIILMARHPIDNFLDILYPFGFNARELGSQ